MKKIILIVLIIVSVINANAQNETARWAFGGGVNAIDFSGPITKQYFKFDEFRASQRYFIGRYLNPSFNLKTDFSFGKVWFPKVNQYPEVVEGIYENRHLYDFGLNIEYKLNNGYVLKEKARVAPYLFTGFGLNSIIDYDVNTFIPFGVGLNIRLIDWLTLNLQSTYKLNLDNSYDYSQHSAALVVNFGGKPKGGEAKDIETEVIDSDKDGVADLLDECPFAAGPENMFGCPDTDGDGIGDSRDDCPKIAGVLLNKGCPTKDTDGDGIADDKDSCPNVKGEKRYAGCPDTDGDGIVDKYDKCPNKVGVASNNGCPQQMEHTFNNNNTNINSNTNTNINSTTTTQTTTVSTNSGNIVEKTIVYFGSAGDVVPTSEKAKLTKVLSILNTNSNYRALIKGYTDNKGDETANVKLSLKRATTVWSYLVNNGLSGDKADVYGFGEYNQEASTDKENRKVVIEIVK